MTWLPPDNLCHRVTGAPVATSACLSVMCKGPQRTNSKLAGKGNLIGLQLLAQALHG